MYGVVCTVSGTTITAGKTVNISAIPDSATKVICMPINDSSVAFIHSGNSWTSNYVTYLYFYSTVCNISGTEIYPGPSKQIDYYTSGCAADLLPGTSKIYIAYGQSTEKCAVEELRKNIDWPIILIRTKIWLSILAKAIMKNN